MSDKKTKMDAVAEAIENDPGTITYDIMGFKFALPRELLSKMPEGFTVLDFVAGMVRAGAFKIEGNLLVKPEGVPDGVLMGAEIGGKEDRLLTEEEIEEDMKHWVN